MFLSLVASEILQIKQESKMKYSSFNDRYKLSKSGETLTPCLYTTGLYMLLE
jgi:hypothetical protein